MSVSPTTKPISVPTEPIHRLTIEQYHAMADAGILTEDDPVELLEGWLVEKMTKKPRHSVLKRRVFNALQKYVPSGWFVDEQEPITITTLDSEPEPDVSVLRVASHDYEERHPYPEDIALVVEVADATLRTDRGTKLRVYARARIPVYWIVNLVDNQLEVYSDPVGEGDKATYRRHTDYQPTDEVPVVIDGQEVARLPLRDLFR